MQVPEDLKRKYLDRRILDIESLLESLKEDNFAPALKLGHQVKGNAETFDFPEIAPLGLQIEEAAKKKNKQKILTLVEAMSFKIKTAKRYLH